MRFPIFQSACTKRQADRWAVKMSQPDVSDDEVAAFTAWLESADRNRSAFEHSARALAALNRACGSAPDSHTLLGGEPTRPWHIALMAPWRIAPVVSLAACLLLTVLVAGTALIGGVLFPNGSGVSGYTRSVAPKLVDLPDSSRVYLNSATGLKEIEVDFTDRIRYATLPSGEVFFEVAHDPERPFVVQTNHTTIRVLGTKFNVRAESDRETVSVLEGKVQVKVQTFTNGEAAVTNSTLGPGEQITYNIGASDWKKEQLDVGRISAWRFGRVEFDNIPLKEAVAEINRYRSKPIVVEDLELSTLPLSGSFSTDGTESFLAAIKNIEHVEIIERDDSVMLLRLD